MKKPKEPELLPTIKSVKAYVTYLLENKIVKDFGTAYRNAYEKLGILKQYKAFKKSGQPGSFLSTIKKKKK